MFVQLDCHMWSTNLLAVDLTKENELGRCQIWKLFFVVSGRFVPYFHFLPFVNNEQYGEGETSQFFSLFISLHLILHLLFLLWKSVEHDQPLLHMPIPCLFPISLILRTLLYFLNFCYFMLESPKG